MPLVNGRQQDASEFMRWLLRQHHTAVQAMTGRVKSTITCGTCGEKHYREDDLLGMTLEIKHSVQASLEAYSEEEVLQGEEAYRCDKCGTIGRATKVLQPMVASAPLIITLKRFRWDGSDAHKVTQPVAVDASVMMNDGYTYRLYAAVVHMGSSLLSGHYIAYAQDVFLFLLLLLLLIVFQSVVEINDDSVSRESEMS